MKLAVNRKAITWSGVVIVLVAVLAINGGAWLLERALMAPVNTYIRDRTLAFLQEKSVEGLTITFPRVDLSLIRRHLLIHDLSIRYDNKDSTRYVRFQATVPRIALEGVDLADIIWHRHLRLDAVRLSSPLLSRFRETADTTRKKTPATDEERVNPDSLAAEIPALDTVVYNLFASWLPDDVRQARIDLVAAENATIVFTSLKGSKISRDSTAGMSLRIRGIQLDTTERRVFESARLSAASLFHLTTGLRDSLRIDSLLVQLDPTDTTIEFRSLRTIPADSGHSLYLSRFKRDHREGRFTLDSISYQTLRPDSVFFGRGATRKTRVRLMMKGLKASGVETGALPAMKAVARKVEIDSMVIDALADTRAESHPKSRRLWPQALAETKWQVAIDTVVLKNGFVRYGELKPDRKEPAVAWFSNISATITGLGNHPEKAVVAHPAIMVAQGKFMGHSLLETRMEVPIVPERFAMKVEGKATELPAVALNRFLLTAEGVEVTGGRFHRAEFGFHVANGRAKGNITLVYDSLSVEMVDKATRKKGLSQQLKTFIANALVIRGDNMPDDKGRLDPQPIDYRYRLGETFWGGIWRALRSGLVKTVKK
ncbi:MAG TPA: hypothetical protein VH438_11815 [Gemmatimonadales bacterium]